MSDKHRAIAREIAQKHLDDGDPLGWFEDLYSHAGDKYSIIPWADLMPNPNVVDWLAHDLKEVAFEDYIDKEEPPVRWFRATYSRK